MAQFKRTYIAEKPDAARTLAALLAKDTGVKPVANRSYITLGDTAITWVFGHILELAEAQVYDPKYEKWKTEDLPIIPSPFKLLPKRDRSGKREDAAATIATIKKLVDASDQVIGYCDPDAEGQLIQDELLHHIGNRKPVMRLWASALDDASLRKALKSMKPNTDYQGWYEQALARSHSDWLFGINMTRACTVYARGTGADFMVSVGRVQTPTLGLVVQRELEIRNFKAVDHYTPYVDLMTDPRFRATWMPRKDAKGEVIDPRVDSEGLMTSEADAKAIVELAKRGRGVLVVQVDTKPGTEAAPLPFSQAGLQAHCSKLFGLGVAKTLEIAQSLYEKKLISYPRVDTEYLPEEQHPLAPGVLKSLSKVDLPAPFVNALHGAQPALKSRAWDDKKVTAHFGIIPVEVTNPADIAGLSEVERKVYLEVLKRYILQFWDVAKFQATEAILRAGANTETEDFIARGRRYLQEGWRKAFAADAADDDDEEDNAKQTVAEGSLPAMQQGQMLSPFEAGMTKARTKPKKRFTEGTLVTAMVNIHRYVHDPEIRKRLREGEGIGTPATRDKVIVTLLDPRRNFMVKKGKELVPTEHAITLIKVLPKTITTPDMTAVWQQYGMSVRERKASYEDLIKRQTAWIIDMVKNSSKFFSPAQFPNSKPKIVVEPTAFTCFGEYEKKGCASPLGRIKGQYGYYFQCQNAECRKLFRDVEGKATEKQPPPPNPADDYAGPKFKCPKCKPGSLFPRQRKDGSGQFWSCSAWQYKDGACKFATNDIEGKPDLTPRKPPAGGSTGSGGKGSGGRGGGGGGRRGGGFGAGLGGDKPRPS